MTESTIPTLRYALVTGGSRGIGRAICLKLAANGYTVLVNFQRNQAEADKTVSLIKEAGGDALSLKFDVGNKDEVQSVLGGWIDANKDKPIEVLVNNAGIRKDFLLMMMAESDWHDVLRTNLDSFYYITRLVIPAMMFKRFGRIINVVSLSGIKGLPGQTNYAASKAGVIAASKSLAQEIGRKGITVNCVAPGFIKTEMTEGIEESQFRSIIPVQRFGEADEVADTVVFLASKGASYITGEVINVNGGLYT
ncbi:MAG TPA: 3-oxoacyl-ACP reductase FabG [Chitinophagales bacterium]|nr:3-oxoacyl-ACP reductase FabG [Chitinophagales bacterium]